MGERNGHSTNVATKLDRTEIVTVALELVVREGPAALTMRRLATELDVGTPTIYWHVGSRDELEGCGVLCSSGAAGNGTNL